VVVITREGTDRGVLRAITLSFRADFRAGSLRYVYRDQIAIIACKCSIYYTNTWGRTLQWRFLANVLRGDHNLRRHHRGDHSRLFFKLFVEGG
jgi:hypothetical protein